MLHLEKGNINEIAEKVLAFISPMLKEQQIILTTVLALDLPAIAIDRDQLYRALLNILLNAVQAMEGGGSLQITTQYQDDKRRIAILIRDSGAGMTEEKAAQIFEPFFTDKNKGTGLGLAITRNIIESHGGEILVESMPQEGTCFTICLPAG